MRRLARGAHQAVGLDRDARVLGLRPQREADHHESEAEQRADNGDAPVGVAVALIKDGSENGVMRMMLLGKVVVVFARTPTPTQIERNAIGLLT